MDTVMKPLRIDRTYEFGAEPQTGVRGHTNRRILIVEDNDFVAHQCETALIEAGYEVVDIVTTADAAVKVALERRPALILMDIYLRGQRDGIDAALEIFEQCGIRSIFASALADASGKARADAARPLAWLAKPFTDQKLVRTIETAMSDIDATMQVEN
jgi:two-component system, response regulator PdtaR